MTGRLDEPISYYDAEGMLKQQLANLHVEYHRRAEPILRQLACIESMKPPRPLYLDFDKAPPELQALGRYPALPGTETMPDRMARIEHQLNQLLHILRMVRELDGQVLPPSIARLIDMELRNA